MEDDLEQMIPIQDFNAPIRMCCIPCRIREPKLTALELVRVACFVTTVQCIVALFVLGFASSSDGSIELAIQDEIVATIHLRLLPSLALIPLSIQYAICWLNLVAGGWGSPDTRFWCDVKIMYVRGFNTVRTLANICVSAILFPAIAIVALASTAEVLTLAFLIPLAALAEWQAGLVELQTQYDVKLDNKFESDSTLCLEHLHAQQSQHAKTVKTWTPYVISVCTKLYMATFLLCGATIIDPVPFDAYGPIVITFVCYVLIVPFILTFLYMRNELTFCELEVYRVVSDCTLPCAICFIAYSM